MESKEKAISFKKLLGKGFDRIFGDGSSKDMKDIFQDGFSEVGKNFKQKMKYYDDYRDSPEGFDKQFQYLESKYKRVDDEIDDGLFLVRTYFKENSPFSKMMEHLAKIIKVGENEHNKKIYDSMGLLCSVYAANHDMREDAYIANMEEFMKTVDKEKVPGLHERFEWLKKANESFPKERGNALNMVGQRKMAHEEPYRFKKCFDDLRVQKKRFGEMVEHYKREKGQEAWGRSSVRGIRKDTYDKLPKSMKAPRNVAKIASLTER